MQAIKAENISKTFGQLKAVDQISFHVDSGEIVGLIGPNGAGKTTTIRMILDIFKPDSGSISVLGGPMDESKKDLIGYLPEERGLYQDITLEQCLTFLASLKGMEMGLIKEKLEIYLDSFDLLDYRKKKLKELSKGMQQKAQLITAFIHQPKLVIVDEPFSALDPVNTQMAKDIFREERANGTAIIMSTHQMNQAEELCDRILLVNKGQIVLEGRLDNIRAQFAKREILVKTSGSLPQKIQGVSIIEPVNEHYRLYLNEASSANDVLADLVNHGIQLESFEIEQPSLDEIFIQTVTGRGNNQ